MSDALVIRRFIKLIDAAHATSNSHVADACAISMLKQQAFSCIICALGLLPHDYRSTLPEMRAHAHHLPAFFAIYYKFAPSAVPLYLRRVYSRVDIGVKSAKSYVAH